MKTTAQKAVKKVAKKAPAKKATKKVAKKKEASPLPSLSSPVVKTEMLVPREILLSMTANFASRHGLRDREVVSRLKGIPEEEIPLRLVNRAHALWSICNQVAIERGATFERLLEAAVLASSMTMGDLKERTMIERAFGISLACDQLVGERTAIRARHEAALAFEAQDSIKFEGDNLKLAAFLKPFFSKHSKSHDQIARFREYLSIGSPEKWVEGAMRRFREEGVSAKAANRYKNHFRAFLQNRTRRINKERATKGALAKQKKPT